MKLTYLIVLFLSDSDETVKFQIKCSPSVHARLVFHTLCCNYPSCIGAYLLFKDSGVFRIIDSF